MAQIYNVKPHVAY
jgi:hypothetical protein